ncbi:hypothetical protein JNB84_03235 [Rhizobium pusense]|uniref:hypothetical protein n=1 Tax=Agrobacterium pusense TaxID=648995 RepID=UPI001C6E86C6|nr:hypothetical protein [Agrobacterium pusense]MBW9076954.1 hypothetical protein [Agrobacterium pusense]
MNENEFEAVLNVVFQKERLNDQFLKLLVQHLAFVVPEFDGQAFLDTLYLQQANLPSPSQDDPMAEHLLRYWKHKIDLTDKALAAAEEMKSLVGKVPN